MGRCRHQTRHVFRRQQKKLEILLQSCLLKYVCIQSLALVTCSVDPIVSSGSTTISRKVLSNMAQNSTVPPGFIPYPDPEDVFSGEVARHLKVAHPILTVPATEIDPAWTGQFHFVLPVEPYDGMLGEESTDYYGPHCGEGWIKFVREGSKYRFAGDWRYFAINRDHSKSGDEADAHYEQAEKSYNERRLAWHEQGLMDGRLPTRYWVRQLGGNAMTGNWSLGLRTQEDADRWGPRPSRMMGEEDTIDGDTFAHPLNEQGKRYRLAGILTGYYYRDHSADKLLLFYDAASGTVLIMLDFT